MKKYLIAALLVASAGLYAQSSTPACCQKSGGSTPSCSSAGTAKTDASCHDKAATEKSKSTKSKKSSGKPGKKSDVAVVERRIEIIQQPDGESEIFQNFPAMPLGKGDRLFFFNGEEMPGGLPTQKARLGVTGFESTPDIVGAMVKEVVPISTAAALGLRPGDVIFQFDEKNVASFQDLVAAMEGKQVGDAVHVKYRRDGKPSEATAFLIPSAASPMNLSMGFPLDLNREENWTIKKEDKTRY